jgi:hypothetical protein
MSFVICGVRLLYLYPDVNGECSSGRVLLSMYRVTTNVSFPFDEDCNRLQLNLGYYLINHPF